MSVRRHASLARSLAALALTLAAVSQSGCSSLHDEINSMALHAKPDYETWPEDQGLAAEDVFVPVDGLRLHGWLFKSEKARGNVVLFHGNFPNAAPYTLWAPPLVAADWNVLLVNYRGFGQSEGKPDC